MTYNEFITNGSNMMKKMSRHANKYLGISEEDIEKRQKLYNIKYPRRPGEIPEDKEELFYPNGAFGYDGKLTREYQALFCVSRTRMEKIKKLKVVVVRGDEVIKCPKRTIDFASSREMMDRWETSNANYHNWMNYNRVRFADQYWKSPERMLDNIEGNVFEVTTRALAYAEQKELEEKLRYQSYTRSSSMFNRNDFISTIKQIRANSKANAEAIKQNKWDELVHKVAGRDYDPSKVPDYHNRPYIVDGDWIIAKPGVDIIGLPLEQSVGKIIRMNTVTGEEEIYDPGKLTGLDVRERIIEAMKPSFNELDEDELSKRLEMYREASFDMPSV